MEFIEAILHKTKEIILKYGFEIVEQRKDYLRLKSINLEIIIVKNHYEKTQTLFLGKANKVEIDNEVLQYFFNSDLRLSNVSQEEFINNLLLFFKEEEGLWLGDQSKVISTLEQFDLERSKEYTKDFSNKQSLIDADAAWENKDYQLFIKVLSHIDQNELPKSYRLKYKIATRKH